MKMLINLFFSLIIHQVQTCSQTLVPLESLFRGKKWKLFTNNLWFAFCCLEAWALWRGKDENEDILWGWGGPRRHLVLIWEVESPQRAMLTGCALEASPWPLVSSLSQDSLVLYMVEEQKVTMVPFKLGQGTSLHQTVQRKKQRSLPDVLTWHETSGPLWYLYGGRKSSQ